METNKRTKFPIAITGANVPYFAVVVAFALLLLLLPELKGFDTAVIFAASRLPQSWLPLMTALSFIGSSPFVVAVAVLWAAGENFIYKRRDRAVLMLLSIIAMPIYQVVKLTVKRARPATDFIARSGLHGDSFPSGHSAGSFAIYSTLAYLLYRELPRKWGRPVAFFFLALIAAIGFSRIYIGAHFPTDVLGGWLIGLFVLFVIRRGLTWYEEKHHQSKVI